ncbi:MAG: hypothetical protein FWE83_00275 [Oscillospiraceae bacterium]|nr:hypothetical protein [Oscillospiraceae bacterium]
MKLIKLITFLVLIAAFVLMVFLFGGRRLGRLYLDVHDAVKSRIVSIFEKLPYDEHIKLMHFEYLRLTLRSHYNGVTILNDDRLMLDTLPYNPYLHERANAIAVLSEFSEENGAQFLYVRVPSKIKDNSLIPFAFSDNTIIESSSRLMNLIEDFGVDVLDLRAEMVREGIDFTTSFFRGDHHWTTDTALWAFGTISEYINRVHSFNVDEMMWNPEQFQRITVENVFLGQESEAINALDNYEDITFLIPRFLTDFTITDLRGYNYMVPLDSGSFLDVFTPMLNREHIESAAYGDSNRWFSGFTRYENASASENKRVLLIMDSMGIPLATYFANAFTHVDKSYIERNVNHRIWYAIENYNYDLVVFVLSDVVVTNENIQYWNQDRVFLGSP